MRNTGLIPILLEADPTDCPTTAYAGFLPYLDLWNALGLPNTVDERVHVCGAQGWMDRQIVFLKGTTGNLVDVASDEI
jgi:hypothetical protein